MKKLLLSILIFISVLSFAAAREYSYLDPPVISVMDFEVNIEEPLNEGTALSKEYYGELINHSLVTVLIQKNRDLDLLIPRSPNAPRVVPREPHYKAIQAKDARYFPPLLKIYDKKYVETALAENNYTINDLYNKAPGAFNFPDLDFMVLGNVFEMEKDKIAINVRVLNTYRGEELFSYTRNVKKDMSDLYPACDSIAREIIIDIVKNYCSQIMIKPLPENSDVRRVEGETYELFFQSSEEVDNTADVITYNDTYKRKVFQNNFYWVLPGSYVITVFNIQTQSVQEIPVTIAPREIKLVSLKEEHFEAPKGTLTIENVSPAEGYAFQIDVVEKSRDAKYLWEVGDNREGRLNYTARKYNEGELSDAAAAGGNSGMNENIVWIYNAAAEEIVISQLPLTRYSVMITPVPEAISKEDIFGILRISSRSIESSDEIDVDLRYERNETVQLEDFNLKLGEVDGAANNTRVTFLFPDAFERDPLSAWIGFNFDEGVRSGGLNFRYYEKLIVESSYTDEEWADFVNITYTFRNGTRTAQKTFSKEAIETDKDTIFVVNFEQGAPQLGLPSITRSKKAAEPEPAAPSEPVSSDDGTEKKGLAGFFQKLFGK